MPSRATATAASSLMQRERSAWPASMRAATSCEQLRSHDLAGMEHSRRQTGLCRSRVAAPASTSIGSSSLRCL
eukprot:2993893-Pleurochrysis_carterae.AAC.12